MNRLIILILLIFSSVSSVLPQNNPVIKTGNPELKGYKTKDFVQLTIQGGFMVPAGDYLKNNYFNSGIVGADLAYKVNTEVALFCEVRYLILSPKDTLAPTQGYIEASVGPRFYFRPKCFRSSFFLEAGVGPYFYFQGSSVTPETVYNSETEIRMGANAGIGGELVLTNSLFITLKTKVHTIFYPFGSTTFVSGVGGFTIRF
ncbi:MAG: hypothetical protein LWX07_01475 [Bacteroidetes bacterium]|nr:hypothetical protein [Bacteroidota bacterium]